MEVDLRLAEDDPQQRLAVSDRQQLDVRGAPRQRRVAGQRIDVDVLLVEPDPDEPEQGNVDLLRGVEDVDRVSPILRATIVLSLVNSGSPSTHEPAASAVMASGSIVSPPRLTRIVSAMPASAETVWSRAAPICGTIDVLADAASAVTSGPSSSSRLISCTPVWSVAQSSELGAVRLGKPSPCTGSTRCVPNSVSDSAYTALGAAGPERFGGGGTRARDHARKRAQDADGKQPPLLIAWWRMQSLSLKLMLRRYLNATSHERRGIP